VSVFPTIDFEKVLGVDPNTGVAQQNKIVDVPTVYLIPPPTESTRSAILWASGYDWLLSTTYRRAASALLFSSSDKLEATITRGRQPA
jgi:hypothetical protein